MTLFNIVPEQEQLCDNYVGNAKNGASDGDIEKMKERFMALPQDLKALVNFAVTEITSREGMAKACAASLKVIQETANKEQKQSLTNELAV